MRGILSIGLFVFGVSSSAYARPADFTFKYERGKDISDVESEVPEDPQQALLGKVTAALNELRELPPLESAGPELRGDFLKGSPYLFFSDRVSQIWLNVGTKASACGTSGILAYVEKKDSRTIHVCPFAGRLTTIGLQSLLLHEAHHLIGPAEEDSGDKAPVHPHALCKRGPAKGLDACDEDYSAGGSYSLQTEFLVRVARTAGLPQATRDEARGMALTYLLDHFSRLPFAMAEGVLLLTVSGDVVYFSSEDGSVRTILKTGADDLVSVRTVPIVLNSSSGRVESYAGIGDMVKTPGTFAEFYRRQSVEERTRILDIYLGGSQACLLYATQVYCEVGASEGRLPLPEGFNPVHFNVINLYGDDMVFVVNAAGEFFLLPFKVPLQDWKTAKLEKSATLSRFRSVAMLGNASNFALTLSGQLVSFRGTEQAAVPGLESLRFAKILGAFRWSDRLADLWAPVVN